jgi:hypothetical protein
MIAKLRSPLLALALQALALPAFAQSNVGVRAGVSSDPTQFYFGGHVETTPLLDHVTFRPNAEIGVGDGTTLLALNMEFVYSVPLSHEPWRVYFGGGPAVNFYSTGGRSGHGNGSGASGGFNVLVGAQHDRGLFVELKVGAIRSPSVKFTVGYAFQ